MLAPLLLMLSQDPLLLRQLGERQRYLPPVLAFICYLAITAAAQVSRPGIRGERYSFILWMHCVLQGALHGDCQNSTAAYTVQCGGPCSYDWYSLGHHCNIMSICAG